MHTGRESVGDTARQLRGTHGRLALAFGLEKRHDVGRELVAAPWPALLWQQAGHTTLLKRVLRLVKRRAREVKRRGGSRDGLGLDFDAADHLVFDLDEVARIEKLVRRKDGIGDLVGVPVERPIGA
jgi:hypothetical protein